jgi:hypothetical protein
VFFTKYHLGDNNKGDVIGETCSMYELDEMDKRILVFKPKGKRFLGICRCRWKNVVKIRLIKIMCEDVQ